MTLSTLVCGTMLGYSLCMLRYPTKSAEIQRIDWELACLDGQIAALNLFDGDDNTKYETCSQMVQKKSFE